MSTAGRFRAQARALAHAFLVPFLDRYFPRTITDAYVSRFANLPMKIGGGKEMFSDFDTLARECHTYASPEVVELYLKDFEKLEKDRVEKVDNRNRLLLSAIAAVLGKCPHPRVLDFGGGIASDYFLAKNFLGEDAFERWFVCENPRVVEALRNLDECRAEKKLSFVTDISEIQSHIHFAYISGTLQYVRDPLATLALIAAQKPEFIFVNRTPLWNRPTRLTKQLRPKSGQDNGTRRGRLSYPCWILNEEELLKTVVNRGYEKIGFAVNDDRPYISGFGFLVYKSFFFRKLRPA